MTSYSYETSGINNRPHALPDSEEVARLRRLIGERMAELYVDDESVDVATIGAAPTPWSVVDVQELAS